MEWITEHQRLLTLMGIGSAVVFVVSLLSLPWLVSLIPQDYFAAQHRQPSPWKDHHPVIRLLLMIGKNLLGIILLLGGLLMLVMPGQGLLTIVVGLLLIDYPGKYELERRVVSRPKVLQSINWLRAKIDRPPLIVAETSQPASDHETANSDLPVKSADNPKIPDGPKGVRGEGLSAQDGESDQ